MFLNLTSVFVSTNYSKKMECVDEKAKLTHCESLIAIQNFTSQAYGCPLCVFIIFARLLPVQDHVIYLNPGISGFIKILMAHNILRVTKNVLSKEVKENFLSHKSYFHKFISNSSQ